MAVRHYFFLALLLTVAALTFFIFAPFLAPLVLALVFAVVLHPLYIRIGRRFGGRGSLASLAVVAITMLALLIPLAFLGAQLFSEAQNVYGKLASGEIQALARAFIDNVSPLIERYIPGGGTSLAEVSMRIDEYARLALTWLLQHIGPAFSGISVFALDLFIFFVALYYLLRDGMRLREKIISISPLPDVDDATIFARLGVAINSVVKGKLAIALIQGVLTGVGFAIFGVPNAVLWGVVGAIASLVPPFGTGLIIVPAVAYLALSGSVAPAIGLAIWGAVAVGLVDNLLGPKLMGSAAGMHPLLMLLSVLGGIAFFGPVGIFLGPLTVSMLLALLSLYGYLSDDEPAA